jgi:hypothetical protein
MAKPLIFILRFVNSDQCNSMGMFMVPKRLLERVHLLSENSRERMPSSIVLLIWNSKSSYSNIVVECTIDRKCPIDSEGGCNLRFTVSREKVCRETCILFRCQYVASWSGK